MSTAPETRGLRITKETPLLRHFTAHFEPIKTATAAHGWALF